MYFAAALLLLAGCRSSQNAPDDPYNGHTYVDLGLPSGLKWATCNVGATKPEEYGDYFAWGETEPYYSSLSPLTWKIGKSSGYAWSSYFDTSDGGSTFKKYYNNGGKTVLEPIDDAATVNWGGAWRMPTYAEWVELATKCDWTCTDNYQNTGVKGCIVKSKVSGNSNSIFLPAADVFEDTSLGSDALCECWSASLDENSLCAIGMTLDLRDSSPLHMDNCSRWYGMSVRPVCK